MTTVEADLLAEMAGFAGQLLRPGDQGYEDARRVHNGLIDRRPALIARCLGTADVVAAVGLAREHGFEVSVRGGGHNVAGKAVTEGGVMIDLSLMKGVHVDPANRRVRAQGGVTWAELNREAELHGLAVTGGAVSTTGIAGLTLGGGLGWMMSKHGLAADNLVSAEVVTADGTVLVASEDENADLFWALRGGGGNFGVVCSFEYRLHPVGPVLTGGVVVHPFSDAVDVLRFFREFTTELPDDLMLFGGLIHAPDGSGAKLAGTLVCHFGTPDRAQQDLEPLLSYGSPVDVEVGPMPYTAVNSMIDGAFPRGMLTYWKASFLRNLSDAAIDTIVERFAACPSPMSMTILEPFHGEVTRVPADATAVPHREKGYNFVLASVWSDPGASAENVTWTRDTFDAMEPFLVKRRWLNYLEDEAGEDTVRTAYGQNYDRLVELKTRYDPANLFRMNQNIPPRG